MNADRHVTDLLPIYALGALEETEGIAVAQHLVVCHTCRVELASYEGVVSQLALAAPDAIPSAGLKRRLTDRIQTPPQEVPRPHLPWWRALADTLRRTSPEWGLASLALIIVLATSNLMLWQRVNRLGTAVAPTEMRIVALAGTDAAPAAVGTIVISGDGEYGTLIVDSLPPLDEEHQYQLWLIEDGQRTNGGVFSVNTEGYGALEVLSPAPLSHYSSFGITAEPAGGSPGPTGEKVLGSQL